MHYLQRPVRSVVRNPFRSVVRNPLGVGYFGTIVAADPISILGDKLATWYDSNPVRLYTTLTGGTQVAAANDPVGKWVNRVSGGPDASQATAPARPTYQVVGGKGVIRGDAADDFMSATIPGTVAYEAWVNTPYGHYKTQSHGGVDRQPMNDVVDYIINQASTAEEEADLSTYFGTGKKAAVWMSPDTSVNGVRFYADGVAETLITFTGANGVTVQKTLVANANSDFDLSLDGLTAPVAVAVEALPVGLVNWFNISNQLTGPLPDISALTSLQQLLTYTNKHTGPLPDISGLVNMTSVNTNTNQHTGPLPDISGLTSLVAFRVYTNQHTGVNFTTVPASLGNFQAQDNLFTQADVDQILAAFVAGGRTSASGTVLLNVGGTGNAAPSAAGITDKNTLISRGWTVTTN